MSNSNPTWLVSLISLGVLALAACGAPSENEPWYPQGKGGHGASAGYGGTGLSPAKGGSAGLAGSTLGAPPSQQNGPEVCDGLDNDGDGKVDDGCTCSPGKTQACYTGPASTRHVGECKDGTQTCVKSGEFALWGDCLGSVLPTQEVQDGKDNDCNGVPDDVCGGDKPHGAEICNNGVDDDCDNLVDCKDPDCPGGCTETVCGDGHDNDGDGLVDCADPDCPPCKEDCSDMKDNDGDGMVDCVDPDCKAATNCIEVCGDGKDNDGDGLVDCQDVDCKTSVTCKESNCADGIDNDSDGLVDCKDPDCPGCKENCTDGIDNDGDGKVDCQDPDCATATNCQQSCGPNGECCNGLDDNGDGRIDEGNVCDNVGEPCPPGAYKSCDCYCGVHRKCRADGTWGPCMVDGNGTCAVATVTSHSQCGFGYCDYGQCVGSSPWSNQCVHHSDCPKPMVCDLGYCVNDPYSPCP
ncbi:MAG: hypothetical protein HY898_21780 [Deltaproteobacteria bacterium]|nr:hypothetical protein [Deltaproteobacteria bacterium]